VWVFVGIETSDPQTLKDTRKTQNVHEDVLTSVRRIYSYGIDVLAGFIIGFDNDTAGTFDYQHRFIVQSGVQAAMVGLLTALPKTPLYQRLEREGRLRPAESGSDNTKPATNVQPKRMSYDQMIAGYEAMYQNLVADAAIAARVRNKFRFMAQPVYGGEYTFAQQIGIVWRLLTRGVLRGGPSRIWHFLRSLPLASPRKLPLVMVDWIAGLSMRDFVDRHFLLRPVDPGQLTHLVEAIRRAGRPYLDRALMTVSLRTAPVPDLSICLRGGLSRRFFTGVARHLDRLLRRTRTTLTLRIEGLREQELPDLDRMLSRLARHGDRISIVIDRKLRTLVHVDSSVFNLVLDREAA
jgi:hypothetical protein